MFLHLKSVLGHSNIPGTESTAHELCLEDCFLCSIYIGTTWVCTKNNTHRNREILYLLTLCVNKSD